MTTSLSPRAHGFTLVEIALSLGIVSVALVSLLSLLGVGAQSNGASIRDTTMVAMTQVVLNDLRAARFDALWSADPRAAGTVKPVPSTQAPEESVYYFTIDGTTVHDEAPAKSPSAIYECVVKKTPDKATQTANGGNFNLLHLELTFTSPVGAPPSVVKLNQQTIHARIARY